jgi:DNA-binding response OmpR family regulator
MSHSVAITSAKPPLSLRLDITLPGYQGMNLERRLRSTAPVIGFMPAAGAVCFSVIGWYV